MKYNLINFSRKSFIVILLLFLVISGVFVYSSASNMVDDIDQEINNTDLKYIKASINDKIIYTDKKELINKINIEFVNNVKMELVIDDKTFKKFKINDDIYILYGTNNTIVLLANTEEEIKDYHKEIKSIYDDNNYKTSILTKMNDVNELKGDN